MFAGYLQVLKDLKVAQATAWYPPKTLGGTEVYVGGLIRELRKFGVESVVIAPRNETETGGANLSSSGANVLTYPVPVAPAEDEIKRQRPHDGFESFMEILSSERPRIYHQHSWTRGLWLFHLKAAYDLGIRTVLTIHTANLFCARGTMMRFGQKQCDGKVNRRDCAACWSHERGIPRPFTELVAATPPRLGEYILEKRKHLGRAATLLATTHLIERRKDEIGEALKCANHIVVVCEWLYKALIANGASASKLTLSRQGLDAASLFSDGAGVADKDTHGKYKLVFIGRADPFKGAHVLIEAGKAVPSDIEFQMEIYCAGDDPDDQEFRSELSRHAANDKRINIKEGVRHDSVPAIMAAADCVAIPSQGLETGPLVALEAKAVGVKVLGSRLGGIAELISEPRDGILVEPSNVTAWTDAIVNMIRQACPRPSREINRGQRTMNDVANEMAALYRGLL